MKWLILLTCQPVETLILLFSALAAGAAEEELCPYTATMGTVQWPSAIVANSYIEWNILAG